MKSCIEVIRSVLKLILSPTLVRHFFNLLTSTLHPQNGCLLCRHLHANYMYVRCHVLTSLVRENSCMAESLCSTIDSNLNMHHQHSHNSSSYATVSFHSAITISCCQYWAFCVYQWLPQGERYWLVHGWTCTSCSWAHSGHHQSSSCWLALCIMGAIEGCMRKFQLFCKEWVERVEDKKRHGL